MDRIKLHATHALLVGPALIYVGLARESVPDAAFNIMGLIGLIVIAYHSYRAYTKLRDNQSAWVNWIHIFLVAPLLLIVAYMKKSSHPRYFEMLLLLGFAATGYHGLYLIRDMMLA